MCVRNLKYYVGNLCFSIFQFHFWKLNNEKYASTDTQLRGQKEQSTDQFSSLTVYSGQNLPHTLLAAGGCSLMQGVPAAVVATVHTAALLYQPPHPRPAARTSRSSDTGDRVCVAFCEVHPQGVCRRARKLQLAFTNHSAAYYSQCERL